MGGQGEIIQLQACHGGVWTRTIIAPYPQVFIDSAALLADQVISQGKGIVELVADIECDAIPFETWGVK